jgi:hypothetical protein
MVNVRLHKDGSGLCAAISTNATSEEEFVPAVVDLLQRELQVLLDEPFSESKEFEGARLTKAASDASLFGLMLARAYRRRLRFAVNCAAIRPTSLSIASSWRAA